MIPDEIAAAFDSCGIPYKQEGWYPYTPPRDGAYAVVIDTERITRDDYNELYAVTHNYAILLYSPEPVESRLALRDAMFANGVAVSDIVCNGNNPDTKLFETVFGIEGEYREKWSDQR